MVGWRKGEIRLWEFRVQVIEIVWLGAKSDFPSQRS